MRDLIFLGNSRDDLRDFPPEARRAAGFALRLAQAGQKHPDAIPLKGFGGASVLEIRIVEDGDAYRAVYTIAFTDVVYVLHAFQKKSKTGIATSKRDLDLIARRLQEARADANQ